jgi:hypothetical protein
MYSHCLDNGVQYLNQAFALVRLGRIYPDIIYDFWYWIEEIYMQYVRFLVLD